MDVAPNAGSRHRRQGEPSTWAERQDRARTNVSGADGARRRFRRHRNESALLDRKHYYLAHETVVRRENDSAMGPVSFAIFSFLSRISSRAPDYFKIPHDGVIEVGFRVEI